MTAHEVDYHIYGEEMQYVEIELDPQEAVVAEAGNFMMMDSGIRMGPFLEMVQVRIKALWANCFLLGNDYLQEKAYL